MVSRSRMPPPSWTGMSSPTSRRMALIADSFLGFAGEGAVQVDQMEPAGALLDPVAGHVGGLLGKDGGLFHQALRDGRIGRPFKSMAGIISMGRGGELDKTG